jgi:hypothetical protein
MQILVQYLFDSRTNDLVLASMKLHRLSLQLFLMLEIFDLDVTKTVKRTADLDN